MVANQASRGSSIEIDSHADRFQDNVGCVFLGGITLTAADSSNDNSITVALHAGAFINNAGAYSANNFTGGVAAVGGQTTPSGSTSRNGVDISMWGTKFDGQTLDVSAWGANTTGASLSGTHNTVSIDLHGVSKQAIQTVRQSNPDEPAHTNVAAIVK